MQFDQMRDRVEALCKLGGWSNNDPLPDYAFLVNEGLRLFTAVSQHNVEDITITTVTDQERYAVSDDTDPRSWILLFDDALYGPTAPLYQTTRDALRTGNHKWRSTASGTPRSWYWASPSEIGLYPKPSTSGTDITFQGVRHEPILDSDSATPLLDDDYHEGVCLLAAWYQGKATAMGEFAGKLAAYRAEGLDFANRAKGIQAAQEAGLIIRRVKRPAQEYLGLGNMVPAEYWP
jgi:hypothetical protein